MKSCAFAFALTVLALGTTLAQVPENLVVQGVPPIPPELKSAVGRYLEFRAAGFNDWHPTKREMIITTRFADVTQLHQVIMPGGARRQLTFLPEPVAGGTFDPKQGAFIVFSQDRGGGEFFQLHRYDLADGRITLLTDGKSRNMAPRWSNSGDWLAYSSTRRTGSDTDIYVVNPRHPNSDRLILEVKGGGWGVLDWSPNDEQLLLGESISINESRIHLLNRASGVVQLLTPPSGGKISWTGALFAKDGKSIFAVTDRDSEFQRLSRLDLATQKLTPLGTEARADMEAFDLSADGRKLAIVGNQEGVSVLRLLDARSGKELSTPKLPLGVIGAIKWHGNNCDLAFTLSSARSPNDVYVLDAKTGRVERWTESETGGLDPASFVEPELIRVKSYDGLPVSAFLYRPDFRKFPGPRPVLINIHGGPEGQSRPIFQARNNYYLNELGLAVLYPNVRGSMGYGKTFLTLDNGFKREDSVKDIGTFLDWVERDAGLDAKRVAVIGGSYGGYMVLASLVHHGRRLRCGVEAVGISNFLTFLKNTQDYRRDLRRVEYGDERDPAMAEFLGKISPANHADEIQRPLFVIQGLNDPRVPATESEQMIKAIREHGGTAWYLVAKDEGHGFQKKHNVDFMFRSTALFLQEHLMN
ncbi:MAG: S9 family peptidase [Verrucomicrobia bacterium]|nr:S9 family peptidase [Verrucomicrobiota bacterium]